MKTFHPKLNDMKAKRQWILVDAKDQVLGDLAVKIANLLRGKGKPEWHPSIDCGDHVVVINADKVVVTGNKEKGKLYYRHTGFPGALKVTNVEKLRQEFPTRILESAITGMIPRNRLKKHIVSKLYVYAGDQHPHAGQNPNPLNS